MAIVLMKTLANEQIKTEALKAVNSILDSQTLNEYFSGFNEFL
jgi:hypothetical protein